MKVVILAGGFGTRISEETESKPKPMVHIGDRPILWHLMKIYSSYGFNEFIILLGYKGYVIKEYFSNYFLHNSDVTFNLVENSLEIHQHENEPWKVTLIDTGINTMTGGRIKCAQKFLNNETFLLTYGDGLSDVNVQELVDFHKSHKGIITMTSVQPRGRYGNIRLKDNGLVTNFSEKPRGDGAWVNGGFFVCDIEVLDYIEGDQTVFEEEPLHDIVDKNMLFTYQHSGFWQCMDTLRDKRYLSELWEDNQASWKIWD